MWIECSNEGTLKLCQVTRKCSTKMNIDGSSEWGDIKVTSYSIHPYLNDRDYRVRGQNGRVVKSKYGSSGNWGYLMYIAYALVLLYVDFGPRSAAKGGILESHYKSGWGKAH